MLQVCRPHEALSPDMCLMCSKSWGFFAVKILWTYSFQIDIMFLKMTTKKVHFGKLQDLLFYGVYDWNRMLEFLNSNFSLCTWCGQDYVFYFDLV